MHGLNELNRGPRAKSSKNQKELAPVTAARMFNPMDLMRMIGLASSLTVISTIRQIALLNILRLSSFSLSLIVKMMSIRASSIMCGPALQMATRSLMQLTGKLRRNLLAVLFFFSSRSIQVGNLLALQRWLAMLIFTRMWSTGNKTSGMDLSL